MEPVGGPVRRRVGAVPPDRTQFLSADGPPYILARPDSIAREEQLAIGSDDRFGDRGGFLVNFAAVVQQGRERPDDDYGQSNPQVAETKGGNVCVLHTELQRVLRRQSGHHRDPMGAGGSSIAARGNAMRLFYGSEVASRLFPARSISGGFTIRIEAQVEIPESSIPFLETRSSGGLDRRGFVHQAFRFIVGVLAHGAETATRRTPDRGQPRFDRRQYGHPRKSRELSCDGGVAETVTRENEGPRTRARATGCQLQIDRKLEGQAFDYGGSKIRKRRSVDAGPTWRERRIPEGRPFSEQEGKEQRGRMTRFAIPSGPSAWDAHSRTLPPLLPAHPDRNRPSPYR